MLIFPGTERRRRGKQSSSVGASPIVFPQDQGRAFLFGKKNAARLLVVIGGLEHYILRKEDVFMGGQGERWKKIQNFGLTRGQAFLYNISSVLEFVRTRFLDDRSRGDLAVVVGGDDALRSKWIQEVYRNGSYLSA